MNHTSIRHIVRSADRGTKGNSRITIQHYSFEMSTNPKNMVFKISIFTKSLKSLVYKQKNTNCFYSNLYSHLFQDFTTWFHPHTHLAPINRGIHVSTLDRSTTGNELHTYRSQRPHNTVPPHKYDPSVLTVSHPSIMRCISSRACFLMC